MARKRKKPDKPSSDDYGSLYRGQHMDGLEKQVREISGTGQPTSYGMRANAECKLDAYWNRMLITWKQYQAGMVIRRLWIAAHMQPNVTGSYGDRISGSGDWMATCNDAKKRLRKAVDGLSWSLRGVVLFVCGDDDWAGGTRRLVALRKGLDLLAEHFKIGDIEAA